MLKITKLAKFTNFFYELNLPFQEYLREVKPRSKNALVQGILDFWVTVDAAKCQRYIRHLRKVILRMIELNGEATGI